MSWLKSAMIKAVEAGTGGKDSFTRTVRNYADSVVYHAGNAVSEGAKIIQDRIGPRNVQGFKQTVKRLEEISVSCRGIERVQLLRRWLVSLKEVDRYSPGFIEGSKNSPRDELQIDEAKDSPRKPTLVYYVDPDTGGELKTFREVFLSSQALEGITLSMILEEPNEEEESLLLEIYGLTLSGGKETHQAVMESVHNLAKAFSEYQEEVLVKREELLQYVQDAIAGLKINADFDRIDAEACSLKETLDEKKGELPPSSGDCDNSLDAETTTTKVLQEILSQVQLCSKLEELLLKKKPLNSGDSPQLHSEKVEKLRILSESLANSTLKAEKRILDHSREQKEEALNFRVAKSKEMSQAEKELTDEIGELEKQKDQLEAELKKVNNSLSASRMRLQNAKEEREHFDEASNQILVHLKTKEDELFRSVASCNVEANVVNACINFLEHTWNLQISHRQQREKDVDGELKKYGDYFVKLVISLLSSYKEKLAPSLSSIRKLEQNLSSIKESDVSPSIDDRSSSENKLRKKLEEEYLDIESKFVSTLSTVDTVRMQFYETEGGILRNNDQDAHAQEISDALEKIKQEFESIKRPILLIETGGQGSKVSSVNEKPHRSSSSSSTSEQTNETRDFYLEGIDDDSVKGT